MLLREKQKIVYKSSPNKQHTWISAFIYVSCDLQTSPPAWIIRGTARYTPDIFPLAPLYSLRFRLCFADIPSPPSFCRVARAHSRGWRVKLRCDDPPEVAKHRATDGAVRATHPCTHPSSTFGFFVVWVGGGIYRVTCASKHFRAVFGYVRHFL